MACGHAKEMTFAVFEYWPDGTEYDTGKTFSITKKENDDIMNLHRLYPSEDRIDDYGILLTLFTKLYGFTIGPNGFRIVWDKDEQGAPNYNAGCLSWGGPRPPAVPIGGNWWRIKRIV